MTAPHQRSARSGFDLRILRAAVFAAVCVVLAAAGHALASCATIPLWTLGAGFLTVFAVAAPLAGRERSLPGIAAVAAGWVLRHGDMALLRLMRLSAHGVAQGALVRSLRAALALVRALRTGLPGAPDVARTPRTALLAPPKPRTTALQHTVIRR